MSNENEGKNKINHTAIWYSLFAVFSYIVVPIIVILIIFCKTSLAPANIGFILAVSIISCMLYSSIISILSLIMFLFLIAKKKFHPSLFIIPFTMILIVNNYHIYHLYLGYGYNDFELDFIKFLFQYNYLLLPLPYLPFVLLFTIIAIYMLIRHKTKKD